MSDLLEQVWPVFEAETREQAQAIASGVMELEGTGSSERTSLLLRIAHSMKGSAASIGAHDIERAAHAIEDVLALASAGHRLAGGAVEAVLRAAAGIEGALGASEKGRIAGLERLIADLDVAGGRRGAATGAPQAPPAREAPLEDIDLLEAEVGALCRADGPERSACAGRARAVAERLASSLTGAPAELAGRVALSVAELERGAADVPRFIARAAAELVELRAALEVAARSEPARTEPAPPPESPKKGEQRSVRVDAGRLETVAAGVDQIVVGISRRERRARDMQRQEQTLREALRLAQRGLGEAGLADDARPRALLEGLERFRTLGAELGRHARELRREAERERVFAHELRDALQGLRMVPAQTVLASLRPTVREVAAKLGKDVAFVLTGGEVRLDRRVLDELKSPLLHLVRNALDHGIERPEARRAAGKPPQATLEVRIEPYKDHVVITVRDDGEGLSPERLRAVAVTRGLVSAADAGRLSDAEAARLAFEPGISTATEITALSGRGVGLDVVAEAVRQLGGSVDLDFERGRGTSFVLEVPVTLSGATGLLFRAGGGVALVPSSAVESVLLVTPEDVGTVAGQATVAVDGVQVPYSSVAQALGTGAGVGPAAGSTVALLVASGGKRVALAVDEVLGEYEIVVASLGRRLASVRHIAGAAVLEDGRVVAVLQPAQLVGAARVTEGARAPARPRIVVADDSLSTRAAAKAILEIAGFQVLPAADGEEAFALAREAGCDLIVSDVQMPRLDGFGLTRRVKADPKLSRVPVILVTSLDAPEDRAAGLRAGADGYLVKRDVQRGKLLELVRQLLPT